MITTKGLFIETVKITLPENFCIFFIFTGNKYACQALNYFAGLGLALLLDKDCVKGKAFWRAG